jgi:hypothetical protein
VDRLGDELAEETGPVISWGVRLVGGHRIGHEKTMEAMTCIAEPDRGNTLVDNLMDGRRRFSTERRLSSHIVVLTNRHMVQEKGICQEVLEISLLAESVGLAVKGHRHLYSILQSSKKLRTCTSEPEAEVIFLQRMSRVELVISVTT